MIQNGLGEQIADMMKPAGGNAVQSGVFSLTLATVKNINDEQKLNRVRCLPIGAPDEELTDWCYVMTPMAGKERGLFLFPQVDDLVVLGYLGNDPHRPIVLGGFWNTESMPLFAVNEGKAEDYGLKTPKNVSITVHDEDKKQKLTVTMPSGTIIEVEDENQTLTAKNQAGDTALTMKMKDGEIELTAKNKLTLTSGSASITLEQNGTVTVKGGKEITLDGKSINENAQGTLAMQGADVSATAKNDLSLKGTVSASLEGKLLKLN